MKRNLGFSSFEFYLVVSIIGLIFIVGVHRYEKLAEETQRLSFELLAHNFSAGVYNYRARWIIAQQSAEQNHQININNEMILFSNSGWPIAVNPQQNAAIPSVPGCISLWNTFLQDPPQLATANIQTKTSHYRIILTNEKKCRFEYMKYKNLYFEYSPITGEVKS